MEESVRRSSTISERGKVETSAGQHCYRLARTRKYVFILEKHRLGFDDSGMGGEAQAVPVDLLKTTVSVMCPVY